MPDERLRLFVAIPLDDDVKAAVEAIERELMRVAGREVVRWVGPEGMHLTLKFLGEVPAGRVQAISGAIAEGARSAPPFTLRFTRLGAFPNAGRPRVVWVGLAGDLEALQSLQRETERALTGLGFAPEDRPFAPHITLGRVREGASPPALRDLTSALNADRPLDVPAAGVRELVLFRSVLSRSGAVYTRLAAAPLGVQ